MHWQDSGDHFHREQKFHVQKQSIHGTWLKDFLAKHHTIKASEEKKE